MGDTIAIHTFNKRRWFYLIIMGMLSALALPPFFFVPLLFVTFPFMFGCIEQSANAKEAFKTGWCFGFGYWFAGIYWVSFSLGTDIEQFWWLIPITIVSLPALMAVYIGFAAYVAYILPRERWKKLLVFVCVWVLGEMFRAYVIALPTMYGSPWNYIGYVWTLSTPTMQLASIVGIHGLSFLTLLLVLMPILAVSIKKDKKNYVVSYVNFGRVVAVILLLLVMHYGYGYYRLRSTVLHVYDDMNFRLVQTNLYDHHNWNPYRMSQVVQKNIQMSQAPGHEDMQALIWSESAVPYMIEDNEAVREEVIKAIPEYGILLTGSMRVEHDESTGQVENLYSTLHALSKEGETLGVYDKYRLVAFGEFIPFRNILNLLPIRNVVGGQDFSPGLGGKTIITRRVLAYSPLICYDAIFPHSVDGGKNEAFWMLNITNDAWFEKRLDLWNGKTIQLSTGPYQHFQMVRLRAVEQGMSMVRVANTGISANITPLGQIAGKIDLGQEGILDTRLFAKLTNSTIYSKFGDTLVLLLMYMCGLFALVKGNLNRVF